MSEWQDVMIIGRDREQSYDAPVETEDGLELGRQVFKLSRRASEQWRAHFHSIFINEPGRPGRMAVANATSIELWGGAYIFDERDVEHLKALLDYANWNFRERFETTGDISGLDAFG